MNIDSGTYKIIRVDGTETLVDEKPTLRKVYRDIGCECVDSVVLSHRPKIVMLVDDNGMIDGRPVNAKATDLYHARCMPGTLHGIHGDVVVCRDGDFA